MNFRQIEAFRTVMTTGSVTGAAQLLAISQPAVSRLLSDLEKNVGFPLFQRQGRKLAATEEASNFHAEVDRAFVGLEELKAAAESIRNHQSGTLNLVTMPGLASRFLPEIIQAFSEHYSSVGIWLEVLPRHAVLDAVKSGQYDLGISSGPVQDQGLQSETLCNLQAYCVLPTAHRLADRSTIEPKQLEGERFITLAKDSLFRHAVMTLLDQHHVKCRMDIQARTADAVYGMVAAGLGVSIIGPELPFDGIAGNVLFKPLSPSMQIEIDLLYPGHKSRSRLARLFSDTCYHYSQTA